MHAPLNALQVSKVQAFLSSQSAWSLQAPPQPAIFWKAHAPLFGSQASVVQASLSSQLAICLKTQPFLSSWHWSSVQGSPSLHTTGAPVQALALQTSPLVHGLASLREAPSGAAVNLQLPVLASQASRVQGLPSVHTLAVPAAQPVPLQTSPAVQALPSSQGLPPIPVNAHAPTLQVSAVQALASSQAGSVPALHTPARHASPTVHVLAPKAHGLPLTAAPSNVHAPVPTLQPTTIGTARMNRHRSTGRLDDSRPVANGAGPPARGQQRKLALGGIGAFNAQNFAWFWWLTGAGSRAQCPAAGLPDGPVARIGRILMVASEAMCLWVSYPPPTWFS